MSQKRRELLWPWAAVIPVSLWMVAGGVAWRRGRVCGVPKCSAPLASVKELPML